MRSTGPISGRSLFQPGVLGAWNYVQRRRGLGQLHQSLCLRHSTGRSEEAKKGCAGDILQRGQGPRDLEGHGHLGTGQCLYLYCQDWIHIVPSHSGKTVSSVRAEARLVLFVAIIPEPEEGAYETFVKRKIA